MHNAPIGRNRSLTLRAGGGYIRHMAEKRKFLGVHFKCCNAYARVYADRQRGHRQPLLHRSVTPSSRNPTTSSFVRRLISASLVGAIICTLE